MISILKPAVQTTIQDSGRRGFRHLGVPRCGAMDPLALMIGNRLVGNGEEAAGLELCLPPARIRMEVDCVVALTGADCSAQLDDMPVRVCRRVAVHAGQTLQLLAASQGFRAYLCIAGGFDVPRVMGSRSTDLQAGMGGLEGRLLRRGDVLKILPSIVRDHAPAGVSPPRIGNLIRVIPGPEFDSFAPQSRDALYRTPWKVTTQSNRMGYRLAGPELSRQDNPELRSHAVFPGVIQVLPNGLPIVLMADAQATGGYHTIACVIAADQWRLAQIAPGSSIHFGTCTRDAALLALQEQMGLYAH
jgi:biotin-dependent carboxylase-like uncharacterized protein